MMFAMRVRIYTPLVMMMVVVALIEVVMQRYLSRLAPM
jgi:hypothetical protein